MLPVMGLGHLKGGKMNCGRPVDPGSWKDVDGAELAKMVIERKCLAHM
jgi:hypothetical protein